MVRQVELMLSHNKVHLFDQVFIRHIDVAPAIELTIDQPVTPKIIS
jgi:hypothetical protein